MFRRLAFIVVFLAAASEAMTQTIPQTMSYQGYVTDAGGTPIADGNYALTFALYSSESGGSALWTETHSQVAVAKGLFSVILGKGTPPRPLSLGFDQEYFLGISINSSPEMTPRVQLASSAWSFRAGMANGVQAASITDASIAPSAGIAASKLDPTVLTESDIIAGSGVSVSNAGGQLTIATTGSGGGLTLPYTGTGSTVLGNPLFRLNQSGSGIGALFTITGATSQNDAIKVLNQSTESASNAGSFVAEGGTGIEARTNSTTKPAVYANNTSTGPSAEFTSFTASTGPTVSIQRTAGTGVGLNITNAGDGDALDARSASSTNPTIWAYNTSPASGAQILALGDDANKASPVFSVTRAGDVSASTYTASTTLNTGTPAAGRTYRDNVVYVWGRINTDGTFTSQSFGIQSVTRNNADSSYTIVFKTTFSSYNDFAAVVTPIASNNPEFAVVNPLSASSCRVAIRVLTTGGYARRFFDDFYIIVTGRP